MRGLSLSSVLVEVVGAQPRASSSAMMRPVVSLGALRLRFLLVEEEEVSAVRYFEAR